MPALTQAEIAAALAATPLFEAKSWRLSPQPWPLSSAEVAELEAIGDACLQFLQALETLYLRSAAGRNLLRNRALLAPWAAEYLDRGKPARLVELSRQERARGQIPVVLRPDLLRTAEGFSLTELDSVPGGIGLTSYLSLLYAAGGAPGVIGGGGELVEAFYRALAALAPGREAPLVVLAVSDEAATYRPEMDWIAARLQAAGRRVYAVHPDQLFPLGSSVCVDIDGSPEKVDVLYRFFELFDLPSVPQASFLLNAWLEGEVALSPPPRPFQEEKLALALLHHHRLTDYWREALPRETLERLLALVPRSWVVDTSPLPPGAVLDGPTVGGRPISDWRQLGAASQRERDLILKVSGFHETAWGARGVVLGNDVSREDWQAAVERACSGAAGSVHILQEYRKPVRLRHPLYPAVGPATEAEGRLRLCPYFIVEKGKARLHGALATFCPPDKKIIHGMSDAALLPSARV